MELPSALSLPPAMATDPATLANLARGRDARSLDAVAEGFESLFVSLLVKHMRQTLEPGTMFANDNSDILGGLFDITMGQHLAKAGALGIGTMLRQQLAQRYRT